MPPWHRAGLWHHCLCLVPTEPKPQRITGFEHRCRDVTPPEYKWQILKPERLSVLLVERPKVWQDNFPSPAPLKSRFAAGVVPAWVPCSPIFAILIRRKFYLAVPGAPNCLALQHQTETKHKMWEPKIQWFNQRTDTWEVGNVKMHSGCWEKKMKSHQAGSSSPYSAGRDLQFSRDDGLALTIPNNILISLTHTDQNCVRSSKNAHLHTAQCGTAPSEPAWGSHTSKHPAEPKSS